MESLQSVLPAVGTKDWMLSVDLSDAYLHIPVHQTFQKYLRFAIGHQHFKFQSLPFGISTAPRTFTKVLLPVIAHLREKGLRVLSRRHTTPSRQPTNSASTSYNTNLHTPTVWLDNKLEEEQTGPGTKSHFPRCQDRHQFQHSRTSPSENRTTGSENKEAPGRRVPIGQNVSKHPGFNVFHLFSGPNGRRTFQNSFLRQWNGSSLNQWIMINPAVKKSAWWWTQISTLTRSRPIVPPIPEIMTTDASLQVWGAHYQQGAQGRWSFHPQGIVSNILELRAAWQALLTFNHSSQGGTFSYAWTTRWL